MSLWQKILTQPNLESQFKSYYDQMHQAEIRHLFAQWIEEKFMTPIPMGDDNYATTFQNEIKAKLRQVASSSDAQTSYKLSEIFTKISNIPPGKFFDHLRNGIAHELQATTRTFNGGQPSPGSGTNPLFNPASLQQLYQDLNGGIDGCHQIRISLDEMKQAVDILSTNVKEFHLSCEKLHILYHEYQMLSSNQQQQQQQAKAAQVTEGYDSVRQQKVQLSASLHKVIIKYDELKKLTIDGELKKWQHNQAQSGNGAPFKDNLDTIQYCIEVLIEIACSISNFVVAIHTCIIKCGTLNLDIGGTSDLSEIKAAIEKYKRDVIISAFIVEKQPPQVMKTNTRFAATVRWLIGNQLGICATPAMVECIILSESQAKRYYSSHRSMGDPRPGSSGEILNNSGTMEYNSQTRHFSVHFRNMQLKKIKRTEKKGTESVMDEKFALLFYTNLDVHNGNDFHNGTTYKIAAWTLSLPVVVIVHGNQEPQSWATITWDNAFSDIGREPFDVPDQVSWSQLAMALNTKFASATQRALTDENISFLFEKIFRGDINNDYKEVTWSLFCKEPLPDQQFTFWEWFFAIMKLTKDHILKPWCAGTIIGFINKTKAKEILRECPAGTFILRFSDSELGAISIGFVNEDQTVYNLQPWTSRDLNVLSLPDRIRDIQNLKYLYPNIEKDQAFGEFYSTRDDDKVTPTGDGYVKTSITSTIPSLNPTCQNRTPNHMMQSPAQLDMNTSNMMYNHIYPDFQGTTDFSELEFSSLN